VEVLPSQKEYKPGQKATVKVKLTDFELGRMTPETRKNLLSKTLGSSEADAKIAGTLPYMSPEQRDGKVPDARSDIYTFGVLLFEALTGECPQPGDKPSELAKGLLLGADVDRLFERCFTRYERRYVDGCWMSDAEISRVLQRDKVRAILDAAPDVIVSANPGCIVHLAGAGLDVRHPLDIIAWALDGR